MPGDREIIDIHCHLFNAKYYIMEYLEAKWNILWGDYPHKSKSTAERRGMVPGREPSILEGVREFAAWIARMIQAALSNCEGNYQNEKDEFQKSTLGSGTLVMTPLMMDIYFAWDDNKDEESGHKKRTVFVEPFIVPEDRKGFFDRECEELKKLVEEELGKLPATSRQRALYAKDVDSVFEEALNELLITEVAFEAQESTLLGTPNPYEIELSCGFNAHMRDLEKLSKDHPDVIPFLAVDPRRIGVMELIEMKLNEGNGVFKGIKVYPQLGFLPSHPRLAEVFEYCEKNNVPVTTHTSSMGGIKNYESENYVVSWVEDNNHLENFEDYNGNKGQYYSDPEKWRPVLERWPKLRLNFAHFGGNNQFEGQHDPKDIKWMNSIIDLMKKYENVYADLSYYTRKETLAYITEIMKKNDILKSRLMFGTDYIMIMLNEELGGLDNYFDNFFDFETSLSEGLLRTNALSFLGRLP
jgi:predicted TIM-barrel fold metal-dependent hydrolase